MTKLRVGVLRGGPSNEYDVSLQTGGTVLRVLADRHKLHDIFISKDGTWHVDGIERSPDRIIKHLDVVFNALHGEFGEDGKVQQFLDTHKKAYTGSGALGSALAMNKHLAKKIAKQHGIKTALHTLVRKGEDVYERAVHIFKTFPHPSIVKPVSSGSSIGVTVAYTLKDLEKALEIALEHSPIALVEEFITGKEATCGVIDHFRGEALYALPPVEIVKPKKDGHWSYEDKYGEETRKHCPGNFTHAENEQIRKLAIEAHKALGLRHYSRADFIISPRRGIYLLEVNTLPGLTEHSLFPKSLEAVGAHLPDFLDHLITLAVKKK